MGKYLLVFKNSLQDNFAYRTNFLLWRVRAIVTILITYFLWLEIFKDRTQLFDYKREEMLTYILLLTFLNGIVLSTQVWRIAQEINYGILSNILLKPINYLYYNVSRDLASKVLNTFFSIFEIAMFIYYLKPPVVIQTDITLLIIFLATIFFSALLYFEISVILSFIGFWSKETWAPRFLFFILVSFLAGMYFPLDILPKGIYNIMQLLPFTYLLFFPLRIYLGKVDFIFISRGYIVMLFWILVLWYFMKILWKAGLKVYTAEGQ